MTATEIIVGVVLILASVFLVVAVLMQSGKSHGLGTIAGGAETFFGKSKASEWDARLARLTTVVAIVFTAIVIAAYLIF